MENNNWILDRIESFKEKDFLIEENNSYKFLQLKDNIRRYIDILRVRGIKEGKCVSLIGDYSFEMISLTIALIINKNILVPVDKAAIGNLDEILEVAQVEFLIELTENNIFKMKSIQNEVSSQLIKRLQIKNESGIIIFTSGSSGKSKAAVLQVSKLIQNYKIDIRKSYRSLIFLKLDHIGGINTLFSIMLNGGTIVTIKDRTANEVCKTIEKNKVELLPTTPTFLNMLIISGIYKKYDLSSLKIISYGTETMPISTLNELSKCFEGVKLKQTYGLTELGIFSTKSKESNSVWMKVGGEGIEVRIIDNTLWIKSKSAMLGYINAPSPFNEKGWYNTGDKVEIDGEYIRILGRESEIINVGGEKVFPAEVENLLLEIDNIKEVLVYGKQNAITGQIVASIIQLEKPEELKALKKRIIEYCKDKIQSYKIPRLITITDENLVGNRFKKIRNVKNIL